MNNFQLETFDDKDQRDERYDDLRKRVNADGTIGRRGLVKFSGVAIVEGGGRIFPNYAGRLDIRHEKKGAVIVHGRLRLSALSTWSIAYPRLLPPKQIDRGPVASGPTPKRRRRLERFRKRHPRVSSNFKSRGPRGVPHAMRMARFVEQSRLNGEKERA